MKYISVKEASEKWGISERRVRALCESGRIEGVTRCGDWVWSIPAGTARPADGRTLRYIKNMSLRTGTHDYKAIDVLKKSSNSVLKENDIARVIQSIFYFEGKSIETEQILKTFKLENQNLPLVNQLEILNLKSVLSNLKFDISEESLKTINKRLCQNIDEKKGGKYKLNSDQAQKVEALITQYYGSWSVLHPLARASFLFTELLRIDLFQNYNAQTAFVVLANELAKAKLPTAVFSEGGIAELKAALVSSQIRGNAQTLISMISQAL